MHRRHFLGVALATLATPAFAKKASEQPRVLSLRHLHTDERLEVVYRVGERYQRPALAKLDNFFRDFRTGESTPVDPKLFDLLYDIQAYLGGSGARYDVLSGYRSPKTNQMLRTRSGGVAKNSLHLRGQAIDIRLPELATSKVRDAAVALARGGVGYYARSDFVHLDTGNVRRWGA